MPLSTQLLRCMVDNAPIEQDAAGNWTPWKKNQGRIDGIVALVMESVLMVYGMGRTRRDCVR